MARGGGSGRLGGGSAGGQQADQRVPVGEHLVLGDGAQVLEQAEAGAEPLPGPLPEGFGEFAGGVQGEGEEVGDDEHAGEGVPAVAEVVLEVVAVLLEDVEVSFSIFQRARAQSASSATLPRSTGRLVTKAPR